MPCGFSDDAYGCEKLGPSKEGRIIPMDVPFTVDTIPAYMENIEEKAREAKEKGDSVGGIVRCVIKGVPAGVGDPIFDGVENLISSAVFIYYPCVLH